MKHTVMLCLFKITKESKPKPAIDAQSSLLYPETGLPAPATSTSPPLLDPSPTVGPPMRNLNRDMGKASVSQHPAHLTQEHRLWGPEFQLPLSRADLFFTVLWDVDDIGPSPPALEKQADRLKEHLMNSK